MHSLTQSCGRLQAEIEGLLETPLATIFKDNASAQRSIPLAADAGGFFLQQRALHVFAEAERVLKFRDVCNSSDLGQEEKLQRLGQLMDESQTSCRLAISLQGLSEVTTGVPAGTSYA